ncbi:MAG: electron transfer flavoprotein subunit alpha/FixB family protein, partial [Betaproteobacteria bacterium]|nr:electron transfer flavoprotein subunit alpha/FixB family protein [Betaproteobacteria bacterium]
AGREIIAASGGGELQVVVAGADCLAVAQAAAGLEGVSGVIQLDGPALAQGLAEDLVDALLAQVRARDVRAVVFPATTNGKNWAPRLAALLDVAAISDVIRVVDAKTFERPIYAGNVIATVESSDPILVITARTTAFTPVADSGTAVSIITISAAAPTERAAFVGQALSKSDRPELASAKVVVSGGRALGSAEKYRELLEPLADRLGAALGASRAAVDAGYAPNDFQVGQTGKVVAPQLYIAIGMSGAIQHLAGMKDSKVIVAINKDPDAPIFQVADYGLVADLFEAVPALTAKL